jgi:hypothetical protein
MHICRSCSTCLWCRSARTPTCVISSIAPRRKLPTFQQLEIFLESRIRALEMSSPEAKSQSFVTPTKKVQLKAQVHAIGASSHSFSYGNTIICAFCGAAHTNFSCETFRNRSPIERRQDVLRLKLCFNCLGHHLMKECKSTRTCRTCGRKHNTLLHDTASSEPGSAASVHLARPLQQRRIVLLATAQVIVRSPSGLQLPRIRASVRICGIGATESTTARYQVNLVVQSQLFPEAQYSLSAVVLPKLTGRAPPQLIKAVEQIQIDPAHLAVFPRGKNRSYPGCRRVRQSSSSRTLSCSR